MARAEALGAAFDNALVLGSVPALVGFRRSVDTLSAHSHWRRAIRESLGLDSERARYDQSLDVLMKRGGALADWARLARWLAFNVSQSSTGTQREGLIALHELAEHKRDKAAQRYRQWLTLPASRKRRNSAVQWLSHLQPLPVSPSEMADVFSASYSMLLELDLGDRNEVSSACRYLQGWVQCGLPDLVISQDRARHLLCTLDRLRITGRIEHRLSRLVHGAEDTASWRVAGGLEQQLARRRLRAQEQYSAACLLLNLPLHARFGAIEARGAHQSVKSLDTVHRSI